MTADVNSSPRPASLEADAQSVSIRLLGTYSVTVGGVPVEMPPGKPADLVALLASRDTTTVLDVAVDALWPDACVDVGRRRLRNVVSRCRDALGPQAIVRRGDSLAMGAVVTSDVTEFRQLADRAASAIARNRDEAADAAVAVLDQYGGPLLPTHLYCDWAAEQRVMLRSTGLSLFQLVIDGGLARPDPAWLLCTALRLEVDDPDAYLAIAAGARGARARQTFRAANDVASHLAASFENQL